MNTGPRLAGQTALITGAARRVGAQLARALHAEGANLAIHCHRSLEEARAPRRPNSTPCVPAAQRCSARDLRDAAQPARLVAQVCTRFGGLNLLINNASSFYPTPLGSITLSQWDDLMGTNLQRTAFLAQAAAPPLKASRGAIINIVDIHGLRPLRDHRSTAPRRPACHADARAGARVGARSARQRDRARGGAVARGRHG